MTASILRPVILSAAKDLAVPVGDPHRGGGSFASLRIAAAAAGGYAEPGR
jgi:hypothetical protein